ncbi:MAG: response regulator transcription factor [Flavobacteriaceae bacterium]|tara:strand:+ start:3392 stop:3994 length:603 start_codon:yes stop_codon:yes gene_type:complete
MINILFIDPHPVVQKGFKYFFRNNNDLRVYKTIGSLQELSKLSSSLNKVDIIVSEIDLKDGNIEDLIKKINKKVPIIIFTSKPYSNDINKFIKKGVSEYLLKTSKKKLVISSINNVYKKSIGTKFINLNYLKLNRNKTTLSKREIEVLKHLIDGKRNIEISKILKINQKTVNTYKTRVYNKTRAINTIDLYKFANESKLF